MPHKENAPKFVDVMLIVMDLDLIVTLTTLVTRSGECVRRSPKLVKSQENLENGVDLMDTLISRSVLRI